LVKQDALPITGEMSLNERRALVVALDAAIQAGECGRLLTQNLVFDAVAASWSDHYRNACKSGPARVSYEMSTAVLKGAWRDVVVREEIDLEKLIRLAQHGCGLYKAKQGHDKTYTVKLSTKTQERRDQFLAIIADEAATGGTYQRRTSLRRLRRPDETDADETNADGREVGGDPLADDDLSDMDDATTRKVVAGVAYNVATPGQRSLDVIRQLESARLYLNAKAVKDEYIRLRDLADAKAVELYEKFGVDVTKLIAKRERIVTDHNTQKPRRGYYKSAWELELRRKLGKYPDQGIAAARGKREQRDERVKEVVALARKYDKREGQRRQLKAIVEQVEAIEKAGGVDKDGEIEICTRYAKLINRRYQALDFWPTEVSGKDNQRTLMGSSPIITSRRNRLFRVRASAPLPNQITDILGERQDLYGVDVSGSQIQICATLLGLRDLENALRKDSFKDLASRRVWIRDSDPTDPFKLPDDHGYDPDGDDRLKEALKSAAMTYLYDSPIAMVAARLRDEPDEFGRGLGKTENLAQILNDEELQLDVIAKKWRPACRRIAKRADAYAGVSFTDPFDEEPVRWNPIRWKLDRAAGAGDVQIRTKIPLAPHRVTGTSKKGKPYTYTEWKPATPNEKGKYHIDRNALRNSFGACFIHTLDSMFCGLVLEEMRRLGVPNIVAIHDAWLVPADAVARLMAAVKAASRLWFEKLGDVYADLEHLLGECKIPTRGKHKGKCCDHCARWVRGLKKTWQDRMEAHDFPLFRVGRVPAYEKVGE
jgi:hypothetical protein